MAIGNSLPFPVGQASTKVDAGLLGKIFRANDKWYRLVKADDAIASAEKKLVSTLLSSGVPTWVVDLAGTTGASVSTPAGVIPVGQVGSDGSTGLLDGDYFLIQLTGAAKCISGGTLAANDSVGATGTAGKVDTTTTAAIIIGTATEAASAADQEVDVILRNLPL